MNPFRLTLRPLTDFGTPLAGDTLFGQLCWAVRERFGEHRLTDLLEGYTEGRPFAVVSDAFPKGFVPRPTLPDFLIGREIDPARRKLARKRAWLPIVDAALPLREWLDKVDAATTARVEVVTQNTINRLTGTTGTGPFAPRQIDRLAFPKDTRLDIYVVLDESRLDREVFRQLVEDVGATGFGRDASTGLGKFAVESVQAHEWPSRPARHWLTLAPCAPAPGALDARACYYQPLTRFGRHGNFAVLRGVPFKCPLLMLRTGAFLTTRETADLVFHGSGLGGASRPISAVISQTVHQGYAPLVPLNAELVS